MIDDKCCICGRQLFDEKGKRLTNLCYQIGLMRKLSVKMDSILTVLNVQLIFVNPVSQEIMMKRLCKQFGKVINMQRKLENREVMNNGCN